MKRLAILFFLLVPSLAWADKTVYVRTACANDGDGTTSACAASPGATGAHTTCQNAIDDEVIANANIVTGGFGHLVLNLAGTTADTARCTIAGFTTDSTHKVKLQGDLVGGIWSTSYYRIEAAPNPSHGVIEVADEYVEIQNIQVRNTEAGSGNSEAIYSGEGLGGLSLIVSGSILRGAGGTGASYGLFFRPDVANTRGTFVNNIVYGFTGTGLIGMALYGSGYNDGEIIIAYNNTIHGSPTGLATHGGGASDAEYIKNNIVQSCSTACYALNSAAGHATDTTATNLSEDTSSPNNTWDSLAVTFVSETGGSEDLHLGGGDTAAKDQGTDLSGDAQYAFSTDIDGATRTGTWDIGADEITGSTSNLLFLNANGDN